MKLGNWAVTGRGLGTPLEWWGWGNSEISNGSLRLRYDVICNGNLLVSNLHVSILHHSHFSSTTVSTMSFDSAPMSTVSQ